METPDTPERLDSRDTLEFSEERDSPDRLVRLDSEALTASRVCEVLRVGPEEPDLPGRLVSRANAETTDRSATAVSKESRDFPEHPDGLETPDNKEFRVLTDLSVRRVEPEWRE